MLDSGPLVTCLSQEHATLKSLLETTSHNRMHRLLYLYTVTTKNVQKLEICIDMTVNVHTNGSVPTQVLLRDIYTYILGANLHIYPPWVCPLLQWEQRIATSSSTFMVDNALFTLNYWTWVDRASNLPVPDELIYTPAIVCKVQRWVFVKTVQCNVCTYNYTVHVAK